MKVLRCASENVFVPLTVGGGIRDFTDSNGRFVFLHSHSIFFPFFWLAAILLKFCLCLAFIFRYYSSLEVASEYFRSGADKVSIGSDAVFAAEEYLRTRVCFSTSLYFTSFTCTGKTSIVHHLWCK